MPVRSGVRVHPDVADAAARGRPVVALESTLIVHGLPAPGNVEVAAALEARIRAAGAVPATIGVIGGQATVGLTAAELGRLAADAGTPKLAIRDLAPAAVAGADGATTVASTAHLAARAGIPLLATGGLGGVHREARETWDESADLRALAETPITVVCSGVKSILDVGATLERLESWGVALVGYRTRTFPGFYLHDSGHPLDWSVSDPAEAAAVMAARAALGTDRSGLVVANPVPVEEQLDPALHDRVLADGLALLRRDGVTGKAVTPFLLDHLHRATGGASLAVNVSLVERNAELAARIAVAWSRRSSQGTDTPPAATT